jgi:hypothetical protein
MAERAALTDLGLDAWLAEPDDRGWPSLGPGETVSKTCAAMVASTRASLDQHRGMRTSLAALWRRAHPAWQRGMSTDEADAFYLDLARVLAGDR